MEMVSNFSHGLAAQQMSCIAVSPVKASLALAGECFVNYKFVFWKDEMVS